MQNMNKTVRKSGRPIGRRILAYAVLCLLSFLCLFFFYILLINASRSHAQLQQGFSLLPGGHFRDNFSHVIHDGTIPILKGTLNSLLVAACSSVLTTCFSAATAYGLYVYDFRLKKAAFTFIMAILVMPTQVTALGFLRLITAMHLYDTLLPLILPSIASPAVVYFMYSYMESSLPLALVEAARIDGSGELHTFLSIVLPIMKPAMATQAIFGFVGTWNQLFMPSILLTRNDLYTMPMMVSQLKGDIYKVEYGAVYLGLTLSVLPLFIIYFSLSRYIIAGVALGSVKG